MEELYDLRALRVLVDDVAECYAALGVVHALWLPIPSEFDDYIARPKRNDYRSLHTAVIGPEGQTLEVQIRTHEMHAQAELGVAAHWRYKEGRWQAQRRAGLRPQDRLDAPAAGAQRRKRARGRRCAGRRFDAELVEERIYTLTPKGEVIDLPRGGTVLDFAYHVHTMVGHRIRGAKVNGRIVPLDHTLRSGDRVEIMTTKTGEPRRDWLLAGNGFLASGALRDKVRAWFHKLDRARNVQAGREVLERELKRLGLQHADLVPMARNSTPRTSTICISRSRWAMSAPARSAAPCTKNSAPPARRRRRNNPIVACRSCAAPSQDRSSPCRASATCWCSWRAVASRCRAKPSPAT